MLASLLLLGLNLTGAPAARASETIALRQDSSEPPGRRQQKRFLLIYAAHSMLAANREATDGVKQVLDAAFGSDYEAYSEYRDAFRFPGDAADENFTNQITARYSGLTFDAIFAFGKTAYEFLRAHRDEFAPGVPVIFGGVGTDAIAGRTLPPDIHGITSSHAITGTLAFARDLQPEATHVVVLTGSGRIDRNWQALARRQFAGETELSIDYVSGLTLPGFEDLTASLSPDTIVIILSVFEDASGQTFAPVNAASMIAKRSSAPVYAVYDTHVGGGVVGGSVERFEAIGTAMAELALRVLSGAAEPATVELMAETPVVDWRQLMRFGLDPDRLPPGTEILFHDPSAWERYRIQILLAVTVILMQAGTIAALVVQDRRRRSAQREASARRLELAHVSRVAQLGELSGALAHELNQPLTSILANAEAGAMLAKASPPDLEEITAILEDIAEDDRRAAGIICELRRLMEKGENEFTLVDLNAVVSSAITLARSELILRGVQIQARKAGDELMVHGNRAQLEQVLLNLMMNAADAMADQPAESRQMEVTTRLRPDGWRELSVRDHGPGLAPGLGPDPFRPFVTTKSHGLGLGLSICRTIAQSHGGRLGFDPGAIDGARVILALPAPQKTFQTGIRERASGP